MPRDVESMDEDDDDVEVFDITQLARKRKGRATTGTEGPIFVYLSVVECTRVGDSYTQLLRIVSPSQVHSTFTDRYYVPVGPRSISSIKALLYSKQGKRYDLASEVNLQFWCYTLNL